MKWIILSAVLALSACATPEQQHAQATQYCQARGEPRQGSWQQPPANAYLYRQAAAQSGYQPPTSNQEEFWFTAADGYRRLCVINPSASRICSGGFWDFRDTDTGPEYQGGGQWMCAA